MAKHDGLISGRKARVGVFSGGVSSPGVRFVLTAVGVLGPPSVSSVCTREVPVSSLATLHQL